MLSRRHLMIVAGSAALTLTHRAHAAEDKPFGGSELPKSIAAIEAKSRGRLGVAVLDTGSGQRFAHRGDERFPMCSTFKFLLAAAVLARVDKGRERLDRALPIRPEDVQSYGPVTKALVGREATIAQLCDAAVTVSDNGAANLLLNTLGGPEGLTRFAREIGDDITRLDRMEPELNEAKVGDPRDTTTPNAMLADLDRIVLGSVLAAPSRERLTGWLVAARTGDARIRAGLPQGWRAGDKTGTGENGTANDIAVLWPPKGAPLLVTSYLTTSPLKPAGRDAIHAAVARAIVAAMKV
ncbi:class A beta-lactamase [Chelatococcus sp. GCM10030263]|uniref:class A beta-lactamase n=1 Tax=Chelatococcus sp. GCM10030263 TaxID=3273387 RepID=UPI003609BB9E